MYFPVLVLVDSNERNESEIATRCKQNVGGEFIKSRCMQ